MPDDTQNRLRRARARLSARPKAGTPITRDLVWRAARTVGFVFQVTPEDILDYGRRRMEPRHAMWWLLRQVNASYPSIGRLTGYDHTSVMNGVRKVDDRRDADADFAAALDDMAAAFLSDETIPGKAEISDVWAPPSILRSLSGARYARIVAIEALIAPPDDGEVPVRLFVSDPNEQLGTQEE